MNARKNPKAGPNPLFWDWVQRHRPWMLARFALTPSPWALSEEEWDALRSSPHFVGEDDQPVLEETNP